MEYLVFQLHGPLAAWGEPAVGYTRRSATVPSQSAVLGLLAAALGIVRSDSAAHEQLQNGYALAMAVRNAGTALRDYHTAQVPPQAQLKRRPHASRKQELAIPKHELETILSERDYRQGYDAWVVVQRSEGSHAPALAALCAALRAPRYALYLGRKSCPPDRPLWPQCVEAAHAKEALDQYHALHSAAWAQAQERTDMKPAWCESERAATFESLAFDARIHSGVEAHWSAPRQDQVIDRSRGLFASRTQHVHRFDPSTRQQEA